MTPTAPGWTRYSRSKASPSGLRKEARAIARRRPRQTISLPVALNPPGPGTEGISPGSAEVELDQVGLSALGPLERRRDELAEERVRPLRPALELGVCLGADPERVTRQLDELDQPPVRGVPRAAQPGGLEAGPVLGVDLVAVPVALGDHFGAVERADLAPRGEHGRVGPEAHRPPEVDHLVLLVHEGDHRVRGGRVELERVGPLE